MHAYKNLYSVIHPVRSYRIYQYNKLVTKLTSPYPLFAKIEINGSCNLDCVMCMRKSLPDRDKYMSIDQFRTILDHLPRLIGWAPHGYNEPLLHPEFFAFVKEANKRKLFWSLITNATKLNQKKLSNILQNRPQYIRVSIDAVGSAYEDIRKGASWIRVDQNIRMLAKKRKKIPVSLYATIWRENVSQIPKLIAYAKNVGLPIRFVDITAHGVGVATLENAIRTYTHKEREYRGANVSFAMSQKSTRTCHLPWTSIYVNVTGDVYPCTDTIHQETYMGNLLTTHSEEIYNSFEYQNFRSRSLAGRHPVCKQCLSWGKHIKFTGFG